MNVWRSGAEQPLVSICVPMLQANSDRARRFVQSVDAHTDPLAIELVIADCEGEILGYSKPQNAAMAEGAGTWLLAVNDDIEFSDGWLDRLLWAANEHDAWCVTPNMTHTDGPQVFAPYCMLWRADAWQQLDGLDEQFVHWCSDIDIARRLVDSGRWPVRVKLEPPIRHVVSATSSEHFGLRATCQNDLQRYLAKWGTSAEEDKYRLRDIVGAC